MKIKDIFLKIKNKDNGIKFLIFILAILASSVILIFNPFFSKIAPIFLVISFSVLFLILWSLAGYIVFRSLLTASIGLTFLIFIGQSYCSPNVAHTANDSLKILLGFGFIYIIVQFGFNLYKELFGNKESKDNDWKRKGIFSILKEANGGKHSLLVLIIYVLSISLFIWQIYEVIKPIRQSLCV